MRTGAVCLGKRAIGRCAESGSGGVAGMGEGAWDARFHRQTGIGGGGRTELCAEMRKSAKVAELSATLAGFANRSVQDVPAGVPAGPRRPAARRRKNPPERAHNVLRVAYRFDPIDRPGSWWVERYALGPVGLTMSSAE